MNPKTMIKTVALTAMVLALTATIAVADYPQFHCDPQRTGNVSGPAPVTGDLLWKTDIGCFINSGASIADRQVYVANRIGGSGTLGLYCLNETTGEVIWSNPIGGSGGISTPAISESGDRLFVGSLTGELYCVNTADGGTIWNRTIEPNPTYWGAGSCPLIYDDTVFVNTASDGALFAYDLNGNELWKIATTTGSYGSSAAYYISPAAYDGNIFFGGAGPALYCVNITTQKEVWNVSTEGMVSTTPAIDYDIVYFGTETRVYALHLNGAEVWNRSIPCRLSSPAVAHGRVYIGDLDKHLNCLDSGNGSTIWTAPVGSKIQSSPVIAGGMVYAAEYKGTLYGFDSDCGTIVWSGGTADYNIAQPAVSDGILIIGSDSGFLYAFSDPPLLGDLNCDGAITAADAMVALEMAVGAVPAVDGADMNCDGAVTSVDALIVMRANLQ